MIECFSCQNKYENDYFTWFNVKVGELPNLAVCSACMVVLSRGPATYQRRRRNQTSPLPPLELLRDFVDEVDYRVYDGEAVAIVVAPYCDAYGTWRVDLRVDGVQREWTWTDGEWCCQN